MPYDAEVLNPQEHCCENRWFCTL